MKKLLLSLSVALLAVSVCSGQTTEKKKEPIMHAPAHILLAPDQVKWTDPPAAAISGTPSVEAGGELHFAAIQGDPSKPGVPFTIELRCTDGYKVAPHWHPTSENIAVLKGTFAVGLGDKFDPSKASDLPTGGYGYMPARQHHFGVCKGETDVLVYGIGPFKINFIGATPAAAKKPVGGK
jgi:hypothetical protein